MSNKIKFLLVNGV